MDTCLEDVYTIKIGRYLSTIKIFYIKFEGELIKFKFQGNLFS